MRQRKCWYYRMKSEKCFKAVPLNDKNKTWLLKRRWLYSHLGLRRAGRKNRGAQILRGYFEGSDMTREVNDDYVVRPGDRFIMTRLPWHGKKTRDDVMEFEEGATEEEKLLSLTRSMHREWVAKPRREQVMHKGPREAFGIPKALLREAETEEEKRKAMVDANGRHVVMNGDNTRLQ